MPYNKDAYMRYKWIDARLRSKQMPAPKLSDLVAYVSQKLGKSVSTSSIQKDLEAMRYDNSLDFNAPIVYDRLTRAYKYEDPDYSIDRLPINDEDLQGLEMAIGILQQFKNIPAIKMFEDMISKLAATLQHSKTDNTQKTILMLDRPNMYLGVQYMADLVDAIRNKNVVRLKYKSFKENTEKKHLIHPYFIKEYNKRLYLIANDVSPNKVSKVLTFSFDRITDLTATAQTFKDTPINAEHYFESTLGISMGNNKPEKVRLLFNTNQKGYLETQAFHKSQKIVSENSKGIEIEVEVVLNFELESLILSYGEQVKVIKPESLKNNITKRIHMMNNIYT